jgi:hypothetical protein
MICPHDLPLETCEVCVEFYRALDENERLKANARKDRELERYMLTPKSKMMKLSCSAAFWKRVKAMGG